MSSQIRNFIIAFVIAALVFSAIAVVAVEIIDTKILNPGKGEGEGEGLITPPAPPVDTEAKTDDPVFKGTGTTFNFLLIGTDRQLPQPDIADDAVLKPELKNRAVSISFAMFNKERNEFVVMPIPDKTLVMVDGVSMTLGDAYNFKDSKFIADKVSTLIGIAVDFYMTVELSEFSEFADYVGGVECNVPIDVNYFEPQREITINVDKGRQKLGGSDLLGLLRYDGYDNDLQKMTLTIDALLGAMHSITSDYLNKQQYATLYAYFTQNMSTNYSFDLVKGDIDLIFKFTSMTKTSLTYPGYWNKDGFVPDAEQGIKMFTQYKNN